VKTVLKLNVALPQKRYFKLIYQAPPLLGIIIFHNLLSKPFLILTKHILSE